jgi:hypothetical protein
VGLLPLARLVAPADAASMLAASTRLGEAVAALPVQPDGALGPHELESVAQSMDALAATAGAVGGDLAGFGTGRDYA